jgi:integrative and conjugative element protein (TIGR02256 family)
MAKAFPYTVWLKESAYNALLIEAIKFMPKETGGVIIGYWGNSHEVVITEIVGPGPKAVHKMHSFVPDNDYHIKEIERVYSISGRTETYLGDWHTHPDSSAYLSGQDKATLIKIGSYEQARLIMPMMIVLGTKPFQLSAWVCKGEPNQSINKRKMIACTIKLF